MRAGSLLRRGTLPLLAVSICWAAAAAPKPAITPEDQGMYFVLRSCAGCHAVAGDWLSPDPHAPPFWTVNRRFDRPALEKRLAEISANGHVEMPPIAMTPVEIRAIAAYILTVEPRPSLQEEKLPKGGST